MSKASLVGLCLLTRIALAIVQAAASGLNPNSRYPCLDRDPLMNPTYEVLYGQDVVWQIPPNPKAVMFIAHGASQQPFRFFDPAPNCQLCNGLPEDRTIVLEALRRGYAVIAVKSIGVCFVSYPPEESEDLTVVGSILEQWRREHSLESLPLTAFGNSAGGFFVTTMAVALPVRALVFMCSQGALDFHNVDSSVNFPPSFFAYMPVARDPEQPGITSGPDVERAMRQLIERGTPVARTKCLPRPISPLFFTERIRCMTDEISQKIYAAYKAEGWLDSDNYLNRRPRGDEWQSVVWKWDALPYCPELGGLCLGDDVGEELNLAYGRHQLFSFGNDEIFSWLDSTLLSFPDVPRLSATQ